MSDEVATIHAVLRARPNCNIITSEFCIPPNIKCIATTSWSVISFECREKVAILKKIQSITVLLTVQIVQLVVLTTAFLTDCGTISLRPSIRSRIVSSKILYHHVRNFGVFYQICNFFRHILSVTVSWKTHFIEAKSVQLNGIFNFISIVKLHGKLGQFLLLFTQSLKIPGFFSNFQTPTSNSSSGTSSQSSGARIMVSSDSNQITCSQNSLQFLKSQLFNPPFTFPRQRYSTKAINLSLFKNHKTKNTDLVNKNKCNKQLKSK